MFERIKSMKRARFRTSPIAVSGFERQRYDPDLAVLDYGSTLVSRARERRGFGAPPVTPYGQPVSFGFRNILYLLLDASPMLFPRLSQLLQPTPDESASV